MRAFLLGLALFLTASVARATPLLMGLGFLPGDDTSGANAISADGSVVVGVSASTPTPSTPSQAFRWMASGGIVGLGDLPGGDFESRATGVSADGAVVVGIGTVGPGATSEAFYWTASGGIVGLGDLPGGDIFSEAHGVSADGSTIVGESEGAAGREAFVWTSSGGMVGLGGLPGLPIGSTAFGISADGSTVVGSAVATPAGDDAAFLWTQSAGMLNLGTLPGGSFSAAVAVTPDGSIVVGMSATGIGTSEAFRWTQAGGMVGLGNLPGGIESHALAISADGSVIVGLGYDANGQQTALIWFPGGSGPRALKDVLVDDYGLDLTGWDLLSAGGISTDGRMIVGYGINPSGATEAWLAVIPEPSTALLVALGLAGLAGCRYPLVSGDWRPTRARNSRRPEPLGRPGVCFSGSGGRI